MRRRKEQPVLVPPRPRARPATSGGVRREDAPSATPPATRVQSAQSRLHSSFVPQPGEGYVGHLLSWQAGQKTGTLLRPFRKPNHAYKRSDLLRDPRAPGYDPRREHAAGVRELSRAGAERNTQGWLASQGQRRLFSASAQSSLGALAGRPVSELQTELHGRLREEIRRPRTSTGAHRSSWGDATEPWDHALDADGDSLERCASPVVFSNDVSGAGSRAAIDAKTGAPTKRVPRWREALNACGHADGNADEHDSEPVGYVDKLYYRVTDVALDHKAQALHNEYKAGFCSKVGGNITKRVQVGSEVFHRQYAVREYEQKVRRRLGNLIYAIHAAYRQRRWVCRCKMAPLEEILREPYRYMLISFEQYEEYGRGDRELSSDEWQRLQVGQKLVGEMPEVVKMLEQRRVSEAVMYSQPTNLEEFPATGDWMNFTTTRSRMLGHAAEQAEASSTMFPAPTLRETSADGLPGGGISRRRSSSEESQIMRSQSMQQLSAESGHRIPVQSKDPDTAVCDSNLAGAKDVDKMLTVDDLEPDADVTAAAAESATVKGEREMEDEKTSQPTACIGGNADADVAASDAGKHVLSACVTGDALEVTAVAAADDENEKLGSDAVDTVEVTSPGHQTASNETLGTRQCLDDISDTELTALITRTASNMRVCDVAAAGSLAGLNEISCETRELQTQVDSAPADPRVTSTTASPPRPADDAAADGDADNHGPAERAVSGVDVSISSPPMGKVEDDIVETVIDTPVFAQQDAFAEDAVILELNGYDIRLRLTLEDMLQHSAQPTTGRVRNTKWLMATLSQLSADKLLADAGDLGALQPRMRMPAFTKKWLTLRFGKNKFCEQQLADLIATINAHESKSTEVRMYSYAVRERFNAGQLALLLNIRSFANALASPQTNCVELKFAQRVTLFALDFASPQRVEKTLQRLHKKSVNPSSLSANVEQGGAEEWTDEERSVSVVDLLNVVLSGYGSAIHEFRMRLREEYDDLLNEMARGQPCDGLKGRPLGSRVPFAVMSDFVFRHYGREQSVFESFFHALNVRTEHNRTSSQPSDCGENGTNRTEERQEIDMLDLDSLVAIDDAVDLLGFDKRWDRINQTDVSMVISDDKSALWAQHSVDFSSLKGTRQQYKAELTRIARRLKREADRRTKADEDDPQLRLRSPVMSKNSFSSSATF